MGFVCPNSDELMLPYLEGYHDPRLINFELTYIHQFSQIQHISEDANAYVNYAISFCECAFAMAQSAPYKGTNPVFMNANYSYVIPVAYNCRHAVELILKAYLINRDGMFKKNHELSQLWQDTTINDLELSKYIDIINELDSTGATYRYPYDMKSNSNVNSGQTWVNVKLLASTTKHFVNTIMELMGVVFRSTTTITTFREKKK